MATSHGIPRASKAAWRSGPSCHWLASVLRWDSPVQMLRQQAPVCEWKHVEIWWKRKETMRPISGIHFLKKRSWYPAKYQAVYNSNSLILQVQPSTLEPPIFQWQQLQNLHFGNPRNPTCSRYRLTWESSGTSAESQAFCCWEQLVKWILLSSRKMNVN